ncbi:MULTISPECIES: GNAT family N-acetyltransferase [unclassified Enterobacter]|jgi:GNAT superfamily N-acetyltransferase|uniref:GNAT family N-acetyltransferase n=1 Tax=unclassified Enterobacter TaxID=2608935 RepID=UPI0012AE99E5|nr:MULTISPECIES: GNAT family N-acetyltransferase [unclassified Enterobacter]MBB3304866.1 GNAT superfamily N-acetyltransferase [Enterobacter sp. Sphag1F]MRT22955.1 GNAT family N-acetyltransferase [Enterobacteriaceae bacterium RIT697]NYI13682.1 GNAT superfamily N-acetyltransferase [Enterobacter sp. Sphag71]
MKMTIRPANPEDADAIYGMIAELSVYEHGLQHSVTTAEEIRSMLFNPDSNSEALMCEIDGSTAGYAVITRSYSAWLGRRGMYMEDLYFSPNFRGLGAGKALLQYVAQHAVNHQCNRIEWSALDWDQSAREFYLSIDALPLNEWVRYRLDGAALEKFAAAAPQSVLGL